jgi:pyrimidine operon attenuation protein / uracil phosphoribosyltransferase
MHALYPGGDAAGAASTGVSSPEVGSTEAGSASARSGQARAVPLADSKTVLGRDEISRALTRIAHEILERTNGAADVVLMGIPTRGVPLARRLASKLSQAEGRPAPAGSLDVTMYRDDLRLRPARRLGHTAVPPAGIDGKVVVLVDDVLYSGRTVRAALDALGDIGRPRAVQLAVLVDRGHRELPIRADYVGKNLPTSQREVVQVLLTETDGQDGVVLGMGRAGQADAARQDREQSDREQSDKGPSGRAQSNAAQPNPVRADAPGRGDTPGDGIPTQAAR